MIKLTTVTAILVAVGVFLGNKTAPSTIRPTIPGVYNSEVTQQNLSKTVCVKGWTSTIRPPLSYTNKIKALQIKQLNYKDTSLRDYQEDHFISLSLGGDPRSVNNLWPQPLPQAHRDDEVEYYLYRQLCKGVITLSKARKAEKRYKDANG